MRIQRGDIDGFLGLALDNLVQLIVITGLCMFLLGMSSTLIFTYIFPGVAVSLLIGNIFYAQQAKKLAAQSGCESACALPYGINTPSLFLFIFLIMKPAQLAGESAGMSADDAAMYAWRMGLLACFASGIIECLGSFCAGFIRRYTPRAALLSTLSGIAMGFIAMPFLFQAFAYPLVSLVPLLLIIVVYFGKIRFKGGIPGGLLAVILGTAMAWIGTSCGFIEGLSIGDSQHLHIGFYPPIPVLGDIWQAMFYDPIPAGFLSVIIAMGLFNVLGSLQNLESAEAAGDIYDNRSSLLMNGVGTISAACFGSCFPTTIYIGHPGWKAMGAGWSYSTLNAIFFTLICLTGTLSYIQWLIPMEAVVGIVVWIGVIISAQAFQSTPQNHAPAVVFGLFPGIAAWGVMMAKSALRAENVEFSSNLEAGLRMNGVYAQGAFAIEQGALFLSIILAAFTVAVIEQRFRRASVWCFIAAVLSLCGLMHSYVYTKSDVVLALGTVQWQFTLAYTIMAILCLFLPFLSSSSSSKTI